MSHYLIEKFPNIRRYITQNWKSEYVAELQFSFVMDDIVQEMKVLIPRDKMRMAIRKLTNDRLPTPIENIINDYYDELTIYGIFPEWPYHIYKFKELDNAELSWKSKKSKIKTKVTPDTMMCGEDGIYKLAYYNKLVDGQVIEDGPP